MYLTSKTIIRSFLLAVLLPVQIGLFAQNGASFTQIQSNFNKQKKQKIHTKDYSDYQDKLGNALKKPLRRGKEISFVVGARDIEKFKINVTKIKGLKIIQTQGDFVQVTAKGRYIDHILMLDEVFYINKESWVPKLESRVIDLNLNPNTVNTLHHLYPSLNGGGMMVSIKELMFNFDDLDLVGRGSVSALSSDDVSSHTTDMATILGGAGNSFITGRGVARAVGLTTSDFNEIFPDPNDHFSDNEAWVQNHSYGTEIESFYGVLARAYDEFAFTNPNVLHVFSAGNSGELSVDHGPYAQLNGFANLTGNFKHAKNVLVIGASDTTGHVQPFSSRGPAFDGRIKPELVAYSSYGSSSATALVSGVVSLIQQEIKSQTNQIPKSDLVKAVLINSAADANEPGPDFMTGYGAIDALRSIKTAKSRRFFISEVQQGEKIAFEIVIPANAKNLKTTLVWIDPPADINTQSALLNDLDLILIAPNNMIYKPWILNSDPEVDMLSVPANRGEDHVNNVEQVLVELPQSGQWKLEVAGYDVLEAPQNFALVYDWDIQDEFLWTFPTGSDNMPFNGETTGYFRWQSTFADDEQGQLALSNDGGETWDDIATIPLYTGYFRWNAPEENSRAIARMTIGDEHYLSDEFAISWPTTIETGFVCGDSVLLYWNDHDSFSEFEIQTLSNGEMQPILVTPDTLFIGNLNDFESSYFSVTPMDGTLSFLSSSTINLKNQGIQCYTKSFYQSILPNQGISLNLTLGTTYGIDQVVFERSNGNTFDIVAQMQKLRDRDLRFLDEEPFEGINYHRARLLMKNGEQIVTDTLSSIYLSETPYLIFPNPAPINEGFQIVSKSFENPISKLSVLDMGGHTVHQRELHSDYESVRIRLDPGQYILVLENNDMRWAYKVIMTK